MPLCGEHAKETPYVNVKIQGNKLRMTVDTGATINVLDRKLTLKPMLITGIVQKHRPPHRPATDHRPPTTVTLTTNH